MKKPTPSQAQRNIMKNFFLQSHGLRTPLTAIRWATGRLKKTANGKLDGQQMQLLEHIHTNAKKLSAALESMFILASIEDASYKKIESEICIHDLFSFIRDKYGQSNDIQWEVSASHLHFFADRSIMETIVRDIFVAFSDDTPLRTKTINVHVSDSGRTLDLSFHSSLILPVLQTSGASRQSDSIVQLVGGMPGLMLSLADALAKTMDGSLELEEVIDGEYISDGTVELAENDASEHRILLHLPVKVVRKEGPCTKRGLKA